MIFTFHELLDVVIMTLAVGWIFMGELRPKDEPYLMPGFDWSRLWLSCLITAPAIVLHEVSHKLAALSFGLSATLHAAYSWLFLGLLMRLFMGFVFFVPGYVSIPGIDSPIQSAVIAFAGPAANLVIYLASKAALKWLPKMKLSTFRILAATKNINGFLFVFNMIPIPGFDGYTVFSSLFTIFFG